jgi:Pyruvate/2-oxoglutarate dehydrogenase complex, dihydrolipoamide acyltransferase (E2) component, and related enzymes
VPVIRNADGKSLICISRELKDLSRRARENALAPEEISGSTFTLTNLGGYRSTEFFTPGHQPAGIGHSWDRQDERHAPSRWTERSWCGR